MGYRSPKELKEVLDRTFEGPRDGAEAARRGDPAAVRVPSLDLVVNVTFAPEVNEGAKYKEMLEADYPHLLD